MWDPADASRCHLLCSKEAAFSSFSSSSSLEDMVPLEDSRWSLWLNSPAKTKPSVRPLAALLLVRAHSECGCVPRQEVLRPVLLGRSEGTTRSPGQRGQRVPSQEGMQQGSGSGSHIPSYSGWGQCLFTVQSYFKADFKNINKRGEEQMPPISELCFYAIRKVKAACPGCVLYLPVFESRLLSVSEVEVGQDLWTWCPLPPAEENTDSV